jgi:hypothetical protein
MENLKKYIEEDKNIFLDYKVEEPLTIEAFVQDAVNSFPNNIGYIDLLDSTANDLYSLCTYEYGSYYTDKGIYPIYKDKNILRIYFKKTEDNKHVWILAAED